MPLWLKEKEVNGNKNRTEENALCTRERENVKKMDA